MRKINPFIQVFFITALLSGGAYASEKAVKGGESLSLTGKLPPTRAVPAAWGKDPFIPLIKNVSGPDLKLTAVFYNPDNPSAIVNGGIVYKGGRINGQKVIDIGKTHVILHGDSGEIRLEIAGVPELSNGGK